MKRVVIFASFILLSGMLLFQCSSPSKPQEKTITIKDVDYLLSNVDTLFSKVQGSLFYGVYVYWTEKDITFEDLDSANLLCPGGSIKWDLKKSNLFFQEEQYLGSSKCWSSSTPHILPIGTFTVRIKLKNGNSSTKQFMIGEPGSKTPPDASYCYSENISVQQIGYVSALKRAISISGTKNNTNETITVSFIAPSQSTIYNGNVYFYDASGSSVARINTTFRNSSNGSINTFLNNGQTLYTDGSTKNQISLTVSDLYYLKEGKTFSDIAQASVYLYDGAQYTSDNKYNWYDHRSVANPVNLQIQ